MQLFTSGLLLIHNRKLLLAYSRNKKCFYLPGGKVDAGETATAALCREIAEEMNVSIEETKLEFYTHITAPAYGEDAGIIMEQDCFFYKQKITPVASSEIGELKYFTLSEYMQQSHRAPGAVKILMQLYRDGYLDE